MDGIRKVILYFCIGISVIEAGQYCGKDGDQEFYCDTGHCCGEFKCCNYYRYYEMWWFWLIWCIIIMLGCSCAYYRKNRMGSYNYLTSYFFPSPSIPMNNQRTTTTDLTHKLPSYEEAIAMPQIGPPNSNEGAPPAYIFYADNPLISETQLISSEQHTVVVDTPASDDEQQLLQQQQRNSNSGINT